MTDDVLSQQLEWSFRGVSFPATGHSVAGGQSNTAHQAMDRDGALVETTGRDSDRFEVEACFDNGIAKGTGETWANLYPQTFLRMLDALRDRSTGELFHPLRGVVMVKPISWTEKTDPSRRSGVTLSITFLETKDQDEADQSLVTTSPLNLAAAEAVNLDAELGALDPPLPTEGLDDGQSLSDLANDIKGSIDSVGLAAQQVAGKINGAIGAVNGVMDSLDRVGSTVGSAAGSVAESANRMLDGLNRAKQSLAGEETKVAFKVADSDWTWAMCMQATGNSLGDLQKLNPLLGGASFIPKNSLIRYKIG